MLLVSHYWGSHVSVGKMAFCLLPLRKAGFSESSAFGPLSSQEKGFQAERSEPKIFRGPFSWCGGLWCQCQQPALHSRAYFLGPGFLPFPIPVQEAHPRETGQYWKALALCDRVGRAGWPSGLLRTRPSGLKAARVKDAVTVRANTNFIH